MGNYGGVRFGGASKALNFAIIANGSSNLEARPLRRIRNCCGLEEVTSREISVSGERGRGTYSWFERVASFGAQLYGGNC